MQQIETITSSMNMRGSIQRLWLDYTSFRDSKAFTREEFARVFELNMKNCDWEPHPIHSVFTQYDQEYYLARRDAFLRKYSSFYVVSKTIFPRSIIELGVSAGSGADAYLSAVPRAKYIGIDVFGESVRQDGSEWKPYEIAQGVFASRGFGKCKLIRANLRHLKKLPMRSDLVVVDAAHDFDNEYADLKLALTAKPSFIFVDDAEAEAKPAIKKFLNEDVNDRLDYTFPVEYIGGGLVIKLRKRGKRSNSKQL